MDFLFDWNAIVKIYEANKLLVTIVSMAVAFYPMLVIARRILMNAITKSFGESNKKYSDILKNNKVYGKLTKSLGSFYLLFWQDILHNTEFLNETASRIIDVAILTYSVIYVTLFLIAILNSFVDFFKLKKLDQKTSISLHTHILKIVLIICATLIIVSNILHISVAALFTSLGAIAAMLAFVFKDTLLGLMASLQLTLQDVIKVGDWIQVDSLKANGTIEQITITNVTIRNFDKTVATVPTANLATNTIINWRKMKEAGGRRIKRAINVDMETVKVCSDKDMQAYKKLPFIGDLLTEEPEMFDTESHVTNLAIFRHYVRNYLMHHPKIHKEHFLLIVRQLEPTPTGMPLEIYAFTNDTDWTIYEDIQSSIFEHILGILPNFHLKAFQYPCSYDDE